MGVSLKAAENRLCLTHGQLLLPGLLQLKQLYLKHLLLKYFKRAVIGIFLNLK